MFSVLPFDGLVKYMVQDSHTGIIETVANLNSTGREVCNPKDRVIGRQAVDINLFGSASSGYGDQCCPLVVDPSTWLALIAGIALATFFLRLAIINNVPVGRRRREAGDEVWSQLDLPALETKIEALGGENPEEWAGIGDPKMPGGRSTSLHEDTMLARFAQFDGNQFANVNQLSGKKSKSQVDSLSLLGGLVQQMVGWTKEEDWRSSERTMTRDAEEEEEEESCLVSTWRCLSAVLEQGVTCFQRPKGFQNLIEKALYKIAFHGRSKHIWESLMTIKEARSTAKCLRRYDLCTEHQLVNEAATVYSRDGFYIVPSDLELFKDNSSGETESGAKAAD